MSVGERAVQRLKQAARTSGPVDITVHGKQTQVRVKARRVEGIGAAVDEVEATRSTPLENGQARRWAEEFARRARYLLEPVEVVEADDHANEAIVRSRPPAQTAQGPEYYEAHVHGPGGRTTVRRYRYDRSTRKRSPQPMNFTHDQLKRLIDDLDDTAP